MKNLNIYLIILTSFILISILVPWMWYVNPFLFIVSIVFYAFSFNTMEVLYWKMNEKKDLRKRVVNKTFAILLLITIAVLIMFLTYMSGITGMKPEQPYPEITMIAIISSILIGFPSLTIFLTK